MHGPKGVPVVTLLIAQQLIQVPPGQKAALAEERQFSFPAPPALPPIRVLGGRLIAIGQESAASFSCRDYSTSPSTQRKRLACSIDPGYHFGSPRLRLINEDQVSRSEVVTDLPVFVLQPYIRVNEVRFSS